MSDEKYAWEDKGLDEVSAKELYLYITNDGLLYQQQYTPINKNLVAKKARGVYDSNKAVQLFMYLVESGAKKYAREFGGRDTKWYEMFPRDVRKAVAQELRDFFEIEYSLGNYDLYVPKKYQNKSKSKTKVGRRLAKRPGSALGGMRG